MKSIKSLSIASVPKKLQSVPVLSSLNPLTSPKSRKERIQVPCAFHPTEEITNFCKDANCLLPLCPKCVKIHIEEHSSLGTHVKMESIWDCLEEVNEELGEGYSQMSRLNLVSADMENKYEAKVKELLIEKEATWKEFEKAKTYVHENLERIFGEYEKLIKNEIDRDDKFFTENLIDYHEMVNGMIEVFGICEKKIASRNSMMEGLISFYSNEDLTFQIKNCEQKLNQILTSKIQIFTQNEELASLGNMIKRYIRIGDEKVRLSEGMNGYVGLNLEGDLTNFKKNELDDLNMNSSLIGNMKNVEFEQVKTPLDYFNFEKSRIARLCLMKGKE